MIVPTIPILNESLPSFTFLPKVYCLLGSRHRHPSQPSQRLRRVAIIPQIQMLPVDREIRHIVREANQALSKISTTLLDQINHRYQEQGEIKTMRVNKARWEDNHWLGTD